MTHIRRSHISMTFLDIGAARIERIGFIPSPTLSSLRIYANPHAYSAPRNKQRGIAKLLSPTLNGTGLR